MFGYHGFASASGVRAAVCAAPVRRFLLLAGLLAAGLIVLWTASAVPAHAEQTDTGSALPAASAVLAGAAGERHEEVSAPVIGVPPLRTGLQSTDTAADTVAGALGDASGTPSLADGAADVVGAPVAATVRQVSDTVAARAVDVPVDTVPVVRRVRDTVGATLASGTADRASSHPDAVEHGAGSTASSVAGGSPHRDTRAAGGVADCAEAHRGQDAGGIPDDGVRAVSAERSVSVPSATPAAAPSAAVGGLGVVGYLPTTAAPSPLPGLYEAARHVLRSVPADSADEPTFSPD
ncbi:hypothetical protein [Nocardiopsis sp. LOL_012]|uniref:hypothetical protein n=1 Tax=Nocardiopsis sp. LOL_012 TaxID=3345409 RepID=UPI003A868646